MESWLRWLGPPEILVHDQGNEFGGDYAANAAAQGITMAPINKQSPWENGRTEHSGFEFKRNLTKARELDPPKDDDELDVLGGHVQAARNRYYHRAGFSPVQRLFGFTPRLPGSLLADDALDPALAVPATRLSAR